MLPNSDVCEKVVIRRIEKIKKMAMPETNRKAILDFAEACYTEGLSARRVLKYLCTLPNISNMLKMEFINAKRTDIEKLVNQIERSGYAEWTKHDYKVTVKKFFRWYRKCEDQYPDEVKWIRTTMKKNRTKLPEELLTAQEVESLIAAALTVRDKAFLASLYESGCRISELLNLKMKQVNKHSHGFQITVIGKKGPRRMLLISSAPYIAEWINQHPKRNDPQSPLWITADYRAKSINYGRICVILRNAAKRAGVNKAVNPHNFRHSRATHLAQHLTEAQMNEYMGWVQGSDMPSTYVHLSGRDIDNALLRLNNIPVSDDDKKKNDFSLRKCLKCQLKNPPANKFCSRCGNILDEKVAHEIMRESLERTQADNIMDKLIQDPEVRAILEKKLKKLDIISHK